MPEATPKTDAPALPEWFDGALHSIGPLGYIRRRDLALLAEDGLPQSGPLRAATVADRKSARPDTRNRAAPKE